MNKFFSLFKLNKIWKKLAFGSTITVVLVMVFMNVVSTSVTSYYADQAFEAKKTSTSQLASKALVEPVWNIDYEGLWALGDALFEEETVSHVMVTDKSFGVIYDKKLEGQEHEIDLIDYIEEDIYKNNRVIGSVKIGMTRYYLNESIKRETQIRVVELILMTLSLTLILFSIISRLTVKMNHLSRALGDFAESDGFILPTLNIQSHDEIGQLATSFSHMSRKILDARSSIVSLNEELESKVEERTQELFKKNQELNDSLERIKITEEELIDTNQNLTKTLKELRDVQELLVESGKMALLGELVAGVAHEINTPIGVSLTVSSFVENEVQKLSQKLKNNQLTKSDFSRFLDHMEESSQSMSRNLLRAGELIASFKQVAVDQTSQSVRRFNFRDYIEETMASLHSQYKKRPISFDIQCPKDLLIVSYPGAYAQLMTNLIMNSLLHGFDLDQEGTITIRVEGRQEQLILTFQDDGKGMRPEVVKKVFDPFFTTKRGQGGSGLGMNITYNIAVNILKGTIECQSELGQGAKFIMTVPLHHPDIKEDLY